MSLCNLSPAQTLYKSLTGQLHLKSRQVATISKAMLIDEDTYRVSLSDFPTQAEAAEAKKAYGDKYKASWITKY